MAGAEKQAGIDHNNTIRWLKENIPDTYKRNLSLNTSSPVSEVLEGFTRWVRRLTERIQYPYVVLWSKPAMYDVIWLSNAYDACNLKQPRNNALCCHSVIRACYLRTGVLFSDSGSGKEIFEGIKHHALDDCRHQVRMLVKAHNFQMPGSSRPLANTSAEDRYLPPVPIASERQQPPFSSSNIGVLNTLIESFHAKAENTIHTLEKNRLDTSSTIQDIENSLQAIAKVMKQPPLLQESPAEIQTNSIAGSKRKRLGLGQQYDHRLEIDNGKAKTELLAADDHVPDTNSGLQVSNDGEETEGLSDYGDDSDLEEVFTSSTE